MEVTGYKYTNEQDAINAREQVDTYYGIPVSPDDVTQNWTDYQTAEYDTPIVSVKELYDTIILEKDRIKVKVWRVKDKVYINGRCDTIYIEKPIERIVYRKIPVKYYQKTPWYKILLNNVLGILLILLILYITYRIIKNYLL